MDKSKTNAPLEPLQAFKRSRRVDVLDRQEALKRTLAIDQVLRMRFSDYSPKVEALAPLNSISDLATLDDVFAKACYEKTFEDFCRSVERIYGRYAELTESLNVPPSLVIANVFNNHVATVLGRPGEITAQFLEMCVRRISPQLADRLDFENAKSEPTVFVFGNNVSRICDLIFTIPYKDGRTEVFPIIVLMEHKSAPDRNVVKQMLTSLVATLDFAERYPARFKTSDGKIIWPFVVLFYTGVQQWNEVPNLSELFTTSLKELDQDWIFKLRFLFVSLVRKKIEVAPTIEGKEVNASEETFDAALQGADWLEFFFDLLRKAELLTNNPNATREEWLNDVEGALRILKNVYDGDDEYDGAILDDALSFVNTMCAKKKFALPTREELVKIMEREGMEGMVRRTWLLSDAEWDAAETKGRNDGWNDGWNNGWSNGVNEGRSKGMNEGKRNMLAQIIRLRFPTAKPEFIQKALSPSSEAYVDELASATMATNSFEEFQQKVQALTPANC